jgi:SAM-dependent methyltransferase
MNGMVDDGKTIDESEDEATQFASVDPLDKIRSSYDIVAERYALELADDMARRPIDRGMLLSFSELVHELAGTPVTPVTPGVAAGSVVGRVDAPLVGDVGCGPAHIAKHLTTLGLRVVGYDISVAMIKQARTKFPEGELFVASMYQLPVPTAAWSGAVSIWATLHCNQDERMRSFKEVHRVVKQGGYFLHSFYVSAPDQPEGSTYHLTKWFGYAVDLMTYFVGIEDAAAEMDRGGFDVMAALVREPISANELPARRCYMLGKRR